MAKISKIVWSGLKAFCKIPIYLYKWCISPMLPHTCRFYPTCSNYMLQAIDEWGVVKGTRLGLSRLSRCTPNGESGLDFVPKNIKGDIKWIL